MRSRGRTIGAIAATLVTAAVSTILLVGSASADRHSRPTAASPSTPARVLASDSRAEGPPARRLSRTVDGVRFSFSVPAEGWGLSPIVSGGPTGFRSGRLGISKSIVGPQGAEAIVFWTSFPGGDRADPCASLLSPGLGRSAADLVAAVATAPGVKLVVGPSSVTVGGFPSKQVVLTVRKDVGCDPGYFYSWRSECWGPCWVETNVGDTIRVWVVNVEGKRLFIEAVTTTQANSQLKREISQIVESIHFD